jgi:hypothetical protein
MRMARAQKSAKFDSSSHKEHTNRCERIVFVHFTRSRVQEMFANRVSFARAHKKKFFPLSRNSNNNRKERGGNLRATENEQKQTYNHRCDLVPASRACPKRTSCRERLESSLPSSFTRSRVVGRGSDRLLCSLRARFFFFFL